MANPAMTIPSRTECGSLSSTERSMNAPGSPSSALQMMYFDVPGAMRVKRHFIPVRNPAPPRPRSPESIITLIKPSGSFASSTFCRAR